MASRHDKVGVFLLQLLPTVGNAELLRTIVVLLEIVCPSSFRNETAAEVLAFVVWRKNRRSYTWFLSIYRLKSAALPP